MLHSIQYDLCCSFIVIERSMHTFICSALCRMEWHSISLLSAQCRVCHYVEMIVQCFVSVCFVSLCGVFECCYSGKAIQVEMEWGKQKKNVMVLLFSTSFEHLQSSVQGVLDNKFSHVEKMIWFQFTRICSNASARRSVAITNSNSRPAISSVIIRTVRFSHRGKKSAAKKHPLFGLVWVNEYVCLCSFVSGFVFAVHTFIRCHPDFELSTLLMCTIPQIKFNDMIVYINKRIVSFCAYEHVCVCDGYLCINACVRDTEWMQHGVFASLPWLSFCQFY